MNTLPNPLHAEWVDSVGAWAEENAAELRNYHGSGHRALPLPADRMWTPRRVSPDMARDLREAEFHSPDCGFAFGQDRLPEAHDPDEPEPQTESADGVFWVYMATIGAVIAAAILAVYA